MAASSLGTIIKIAVAGVLGGFIGLCVLVALIFLLPSGRSQTYSNGNAEANVATTNLSNSEIAEESPSPQSSPEIGENSGNSNLEMSNTAIVVSNTSVNANSGSTTAANTRSVPSPTPQVTRQPVVVRTPATVRTPAVVRTPPPTKSPVTVPTVHP